MRFLYLHNNQTFLKVYICLGWIKNRTGVDNSQNKLTNCMFTNLINPKKGKHHRTPVELVWLSVKNKIVGTEHCGNKALRERRIMGTRHYGYKHYGNWCIHLPKTHKFRLASSTNPSKQLQVAWFLIVIQLPPPQSTPRQGSSAEDLMGNITHRET